MAKSLGQIHTVNTVQTFSAVNQKQNIDLPGQLTEQLNRMVRAGTFHKVVGIDMTVNPTAVSPGFGGQISGRIRYFAPTRGRCAAFRHAFKATAEQMKTQGVSMRDNKLYDFRALLNDQGVLNTVPNISTLDGVTALGLRSSVAGASIFGVYNSGIQPVTTGGDLFTAGFDTLLQGSGGTDFVLNDAQPYTGNPLSASLEYEEIPFACAYEPSTVGSSAETVTFQWRPDPALYLAVLCGQFQIVIDEINLVGGATGLALNVNTMVSGWKSIMGNPDKKPRRRSKKMSGKKKE